MDTIKKNQILLYKFFDGHIDREVYLKVICKFFLGDQKVIKCKIITKNWYEKEVYITQNDFYSGKVLIAPVAQLDRANAF